MATSLPDPDEGRERHDPHRTRAAEGAAPAPGAGAPPPRGVNASVWNWLLVLPLLATLIPGLYNRRNPALFGVPFFYWYQLAAIAIGVTSTLIVYRATRGEK